jgi:hypothetical protein
MEGLRLIKERDGTSISKQVERAIEEWLDARRASPGEIVQMFDELEDGLTAAANRNQLEAFQLPSAFGDPLSSRPFAKLTRMQMERIDRLAKIARRPTRSYWDFWREAKFKDGGRLRQAFDADVVRAFFKISEGFRPELERDPFLRAEKESIFRLFIYGNNPFIVPTVESVLGERAQKSAEDKLMLLSSHSMFLDVEARHLNAERINQRVDELGEWHAGKATERSRRMVAECEFADLDVLVTLDQSVVAHLAPHTGLLLATPFDCWRRMRVPAGTPPRWVPGDGHPLARTSWWLV